MCFECQTCGLVCHLGLGKGPESCRGDILVQPCRPGHAPPQKRGQYKFGDTTKQLFRDVHQAVKEKVVIEAVTERRYFGTFKMVRGYVDRLRDFWNNSPVVAEPRVARLVALQLATVVLWIFATCFLPGLLHVRRGPESSALQRVQATWSAVTVQGLWAGLLWGLDWLLRKLLLYSMMIHNFAHEMGHIDLLELGIDLKVVALELHAVTASALQCSIGLLVLAVVAYVSAVWTF